MSLQAAEMAEESSTGCEIYANGDGAAAAAASSSSVALPCPECRQVFRRREHLSRHLDRHSGRRCHTCGICFKAFSRRDTLKRHIRTHGSAALLEWTQDNEEQLYREHRRACEACAKGKQRCDGQRPEPCSNCTTKGRACVYRAMSADNRHTVVSLPVGLDNSLDTLSPACHNVEFAASISCDSDNSHGKTTNTEEGIPVQTTGLEQGMSIHQFTNSSPLSLEPGPSWDDFLGPAQFLFPFSRSPSFCARVSAPFSVTDDPLNAICPPVDNQNVSNRLGAGATDESAVESRQPDDTTLEQEDILIAEYVPHVDPMTVETRSYMMHAIRDLLPQQEVQVFTSRFPSLRHLDTYMQLYFEHCHRRMPFLHLPTFKASPETWQLVLGVVCLGSQYSVTDQKQDHVVLLQHLAQHMLKRDIQQWSGIDILIHAQSIFLFHQSLWSTGEKNVVIELQFHRNGLVTLCRQLLSRENNLMRARGISENLDDSWMQWIRGEAKRRVIYFTWMAECFQAIFVMLPPLLSITDLQITLPGNETHWGSNYDHWRSLSSPQPTMPLCVHLARIGLEDWTAQNLEPPALLTILLSGFVQEAASNDLSQAMRLDSGSSNSGHQSTTNTATLLSWKPFESVSQLGCPQPLCQTEVGSILADFSMMSRVLNILRFTPLQLLYPYSKWQTTEAGQSSARAELADIMYQDISQARTCLYHAAQVFSHFRHTKASTYFDILSVLSFVLYMVSYVDIVEQPQSNLVDGDSRIEAQVIRLDQAMTADRRDGCFELRFNFRPRVGGVGLLDSGRSIRRLYKESCRIMTDSASNSRMAGAISAMLASQATGGIPDLSDGHETIPRH